LFMLLSSGVLVFAAAQPAMVIVTGNNLLRQQVVLAAAAATLVLGGMFLLVPRLGIAGAGVALLVAELVATIGYRNAAQRWLRANGLEWPRRLSRIAAGSVAIAAAGMALSVVFPRGRWPIVAATELLLGWNLLRYWQALPPLATQRARAALGRQQASE
jgi:hypothetical protein